jgi:hypothetical protein
LDKVARIRGYFLFVLRLKGTAVGELVALLVDVWECSVSIVLFVFTFRVAFPSPVGSRGDFFDALGCRT